jgi:hypothetical protein
MKIRLMMPTTSKKCLTNLSSENMENELDKNMLLSYQITIKIHRIIRAVNKEAIEKLKAILWYWPNGCCSVLLYTVIFLNNSFHIAFIYVV